MHHTRSPGCSGKFGGYRSMHGTDLAATQGAGHAANWLGLRMDTVERASAPIAIKNHFLATKRGRRKDSGDAWDLAYNDVENLFCGTSSFGPPREHPPMLQRPARRALSLNATHSMIGNIFLDIYVPLQSKKQAPLGKRNRPCKLFFIMEPGFRNSGKIT